MQVAMEELGDLKGVWVELSKIWEQIDDLKEKPWLSIQPRKVCNLKHLQILFTTTCIEQTCFPYSFVSRSML